MENEKNKGIKIGEYEGVRVIDDKPNARIVVETPNSYDVYYPLVSKGYAERIQAEDPSKAAFAVDYRVLGTEAQENFFNKKVQDMCATVKEINTERQEFHDVIGFDMLKVEKVKDSDEIQKTKAVAFLYKTPEKSFSIGEIVKTGKYFVAQFAGEGDDKMYVRMINTSKFLTGAEFKNREQVIQDKLPIGSKKYFRFMDDGKVQMSDYVPKASHQAQQTPKPQTQGEKPMSTEQNQAPKAIETPAQAQVQASVTPPVEKPVQTAVEPSKVVQEEKTVKVEKVEGLSKEQAGAMSRFREAHPKDWRRQLSTMWESGNYKTTPKDDQTLLQQVRNQHGPEWLKTYKAEPLKNDKQKALSM